MPTTPPMARRTGADHRRAGGLLPVPDGLHLGARPPGSDHRRDRCARTEHTRKRRRAPSRADHSQGEERPTPDAPVLPLQPLAHLGALAGLGSHRPPADRRRARHPLDRLRRRPAPPLVGDRCGRSAGHPFRHRTPPGADRRRPSPLPDLTPVPGRTASRVRRRRARTTSPWRSSSSSSSPSWTFAPSTERSGFPAGPRCWAQPSPSGSTMSVRDGPTPRCSIRCRPTTRWRWSPPMAPGCCRRRPTDSPGARCARQRPARPGHRRARGRRHLRPLPGIDPRCGRRRPHRRRCPAPARHRAPDRRCVPRRRAHAAQDHLLPPQAQYRRRLPLAGLAAQGGAAVGRVPGVEVSRRQGAGVVGSAETHAPTDRARGDAGAAGSHR